MSEGTYEDEIQPIRGDVFIDKILGWLCFACALPVLGFSVAKLLGHYPDGILPGPAWIEPTRCALIVLGLIGLYLSTKSTAVGFRLVAGLYVLRLVACLMLSKWSQPRYQGSEVAFDLVVIGYALLRIKKIGGESA